MAAQQAVEDVEDDDRPSVADMGEGIDRRPADIDPHAGRVEGLENLFPARQRIMQ